MFRSTIPGFRKASTPGYHRSPLRGYWPPKPLHRVEERLGLARRDRLLNAGFGGVPLFLVLPLQGELAVLRQRVHFPKFGARPRRRRAALLWRGFLLQQFGVVVSILQVVEHQLVVRRQRRSLVAP